MRSDPQRSFAVSASGALGGSPAPTPKGLDQRRRSPSSGSWRAPTCTKPLCSSTRCDDGLSVAVSARRALKPPTRPTSSHKSLTASVAWPFRRRVSAIPYPISAEPAASGGPLNEHRPTTSPSSTISQEPRHPVASNRAEAARSHLSMRRCSTPPGASRRGSGGGASPRSHAKCSSLATSSIVICREWAMFARRSSFGQWPCSRRSYRQLKIAISVSPSCS